MFRYTVTIFLSAFLLFQVQPIIARFIVPWFGGTASVWNTCMLFFQIILLLGYCYSHLSIRFLKPKQQWMVHVVLLAISACFLPVKPAEMFKPDGSENATWAILFLLAVTIGLPFFMLSTTGPLIQAWQSRTHRSFPTYLLFALSNFGSLLALLGYPFLVEPYFRLGDQSTVWSVGYILFAGLCSYSGWQAFRTKPEEEQQPDTVVDKAAQMVEAEAKANPPGIGICLIWILLSLFPSAMLLATTNHMCQEVASVPFLWVLPLSLYLITFIVCFAVPYAYLRPIFLPLMLISLFLASVLIRAGVELPLPLQVAGYSTILLACCMSCHGEMAAIKPHTSHLTLFYLMVSIGGALGGVFVVIVAPLLFVGYYEFYIALIMCGAFSLLVFLVSYGYRAFFTNDSDSGKNEAQISRARTIRMVTLILAFPIAIPAFTLGVMSLRTAFVEEELATDDPVREKILHRSRNSYGTLKVTSWWSADGETEHSRYLYNGRIKHGNQYVDSRWSRDPVSYYGPDSGVGVAVQHQRNIAPENEKSLKIGVVGLGTGTIATWAESGDNVVFYEINPQVVEVAKRHFSYLDECPANQDVILGDARIQLERQLKDSGPQKFDVLAIDAFSSDAIPIHLLTTECFELYLKHLDKGGVLAIHISNRYLNLEPICYNLAEKFKWKSFLIENYDDDDNMVDAATWVLVTKNAKVEELLLDYDQSTDWDTAKTYWKEKMKDAIWTDDFATLTKIIDFGRSKEFLDEKIDELNKKKKEKK